MSVDAVDTSRFVLQVKWQDAGAMKEYMGKSQSREFVAKNLGAFDSPPEFTAMVSSLANPVANISGQAKVVLRWKAKADRAEMLKQGILSMLARARVELGAISQDLYRGLEGVYDTSVFVLGQIWADKASVAKAAGTVQANLPFSLEDLVEPGQSHAFEMLSEPQK